MQPEKLQTLSLLKSAILCHLSFFMLFIGFAGAQELYWDINEVIPGPGGTTLNALDGTWSGTATNWNTNDEGGAGTISAWINGANPRFNARLPAQFGQYRSYTVTLGGNVTIGDYMEYVEAAPGSKLTLLSGPGGPFTINHTGSELFVSVASDQTIETSAAFVGSGILNLPFDGTLRLTGSGNSFRGVTTNGGRLEIINGGRLTQGNATAGDFLLGQSAPASLLVSGGGTLSTRFTVLGSLVGGNGSATLTGNGSTWTTRAGFVVGFDGKGSVSVTNGGVLTSQVSADLGFTRGSEGTVTLSGNGSAWNFSPAQFLTVGTRGNGALRIENGARVSSRSLIVGDNTFAPSTDPTPAIGGNGLVTITGIGSELTTNGSSLTVGRSGGVGVLNVGNGGKLFSAGSRIGQVIVVAGVVQKGDGTVNVTGPGSEWTVSSFLRVGDNSVGRLNILNGGKVTSGASVLGYDVVSTDGSRGNGTGIVSGINSTTTLPSTWQVNSLIIGDWGNGALTISDGGKVRVGGTGVGNVDVATLGATSGTLNIGAFTGGTTAGTLEAGTLRFRSGTATINFNQTNATTFSTVVSGIGTINQRGPGTTTLTGINTNGGSVNVTQGTLLVNGQLGAATTTIGADGKLGGTGTLGGPVTVQNGGKLAPGSSPGTLTMGALTLDNLSLLEFELGPPQPPGVAGVSSDLIQVNGAVVLDGFLNVTPLVSFGEGTYRLINYTGSLTDNILQIGDFPAGFGFVVDSSTTGQINLLVNSDGLQFWDGTNTTANEIVNGGDGTWNNASTNWTNPDGTVNNAWSGRTAVFSGAAGTVTLIEQVDFLGLQFITDGYSIEGSALNSTGSGEIRVDAAVVSQISSLITGAGGLTKTGAGTVVLNSTNNFSGGTHINSGTLRTTNSAALGSSSVILNGGSLAPVGPLNINTLTWNGGTMAMIVGTSNSFVNVSGNIAFGAGPQNFGFLEGTGFAANTPYEILAAANLSAFDLSFLTGNAVSGLNPVFEQINDSLFVSFVTPISGAILQNSDPINLPTSADFVVSGKATTGTRTESNIVNSLAFDPGSSLQVFNNLTVTSGDFTVDSGSATIFDGNILTPGNFNKNGAGTLIANSNFGIGGAANIYAGTLFVNGLFSVAQGLTVCQNALLGGDGIIDGNVFNNGIVAPGNGVGTLTINGNYSQSSNGTFQLEIASLGSFDRLFVSGNASLAGTLHVLHLGKSLKYGQQYAFLQAGSLSGEFDAIQMPNPSRFRGRFLTNGGTGTLLVAPTTYTLVAETPNQRRVAKALDSYVPARGNDREVVSIALDVQTGDQYPAAFDQIAPTFHESVANISIEQAFAKTQLLNQRMSSVRLGAAGFQAISIDTEPLVHDKDGKSVADAKDLTSNIQNPKSTNWSLWAQGNGIFAKVTNVSQMPNYRFDGGGFLFGTDFTFGTPRGQRVTIQRSGKNVHSPSNIQNSSLTTGLFSGYQGAYGDYSGGGSTSINSALFGLYASYTKGGFYADAVVNGGYNNYSVRRSIDFSTIDRTARSSQNGGQLSAALNLGYDWEIGKFTLGPVAGVQYTYVGIAPFTEGGAESLNLRVGQQNANSMRTTLGGRVAYTWNLSDSITIIPEVRMFWLHEFLNNPRVIGSTLDGGNGSGFDYLTSTPDRDSVFAGAGVSAQFGESWSASAYWNIDFGRQDYLGHIVSLNLGWKF